MTKLTMTERELLERHYDGELESAEAKAAEALLESSKQARVFVSALEELTVAARAAESHAWEAAEAPGAATMVEYALQATELSEAPLHEIAPLLERFHDGEVIAEEEATVHALLRERDDVADYLAELEGLSEGIGATGSAIGEDVDFGGFWNAVSAKIDAEETSFLPDEHRVLVYRYNDGEATAAEAAQVEAWMAEGDEEVAAILGALDEVELATNSAIERAQEQVDLSGFWHEVEARIDDEIESQGDNIVSLGRKRTEKAGFFREYRQAIAGAVAAVLVLGLAGLFSGQIFGPQETRIIEKTIVVVESVEYAPGTTGAVLNPPVQQASATVETEGDEAEEEQQPTVIWVFDDAPTDDSEAGTPAEDDVDEDDAGPTGQPI